jgi:FlaA1/EpsC-like NDP-sugar epimerase
VVRPRQQRFVLQAGYDALAWVPSVVLAVWARHDFELGAFEVLEVIEVVLLAMALQVAIGRAVGLYVHRWRYGTLEEVIALVRATATTTIVLSLVNVFLLSRVVPLTGTLVGGLLALFLMCAARFVWRLQMDRWLRSDREREPAIVFGAGETGVQIVAAMQRSGPFQPVALLDDNPDLANLEVKGVPVCGARAALGAVAEATGAKKLIIAIPSASSELLRDLVACADFAGLETHVLPPVAELLGQGVGVSDIRPLTEADLLGRREITLDIDSVASYLTGRRVLVTGAGGSIGSELCRQIHRFAPASLVMVDRDESALQAVQISIEGRGLLDHRELVVCCIRDRDRLQQVFTEHRPEVVFHAAALKHLPLLELYPEEGWKTNVWGTHHLLELSAEFGVDRFVNISTDKAADPTSVLGRTKRLAEQLTSGAGRCQGGRYLSVRFGNVLGSRGSVLPLFRAQIAAGGPVTVTHPDVTRYFMTIPEACELVIQAGALGADGEVLVLDMGAAIRIADLAARLVAEADRPIEVVYTGLRPGEKLHEVLFAPEERAEVSEHPLIHRVEVPPLSPEQVAAMDPFRSTNSTIPVRVLDHQRSGGDGGEPNDERFSLSG